MKVLHLINQFSYGGAETSLRQILTKMEGQLISHELLTLNPEQNDFASVLASGISCGRPAIALESRVARIRFVSDVLLTRRPDLLHTTLFEADLAGRVAARSRDLPVLVSLVNMRPPFGERGIGGKLKTRAVHALEGLLARHATTYFHAISESVADESSEVLGIDRSRIRVVKRGRSVEALGGGRSLQRRLRVRQSLSLSSDQRIVLHVGRQEPQKGHVHLLDAFEMLARGRDDVVLVLVGRNGRSTETVAERVGRSRFRGRIRLLGERTDVGDLMCAADAFAFPSLWEGLGGAVLEAMAMEVPVVASNIPAISEVLDGGECGALAPPGDAAALAHELGRALDNPRGTSGRTHRARQRFADEYTLDACVAGMRHMYRDIALELMR